MALSASAKAKLNKMNRAAQDVELGTLLDDLNAFDVSDISDALDVVEALIPSVAGTAEASSLLLVGADKEVDVLVVADGGLSLGAGAGTAVSSTAAELNILDGATLDVAELNTVDGMPVGSKVLADPGKMSVGLIYIIANVADPEIVTIGADIYEFDRAADGFDSTGTIAVTAHTDDTPTQATPALVAAINASGTEAITAVQISVNEILLVADAVGVNTTAISTDMAGVNNAVSGAAIGEGADASNNRMASGIRVPNATEATLAQFHVALDFLPRIVIAQVRVTSTGVAKAWDGDVIVVSGSPDYITFNNDGAVDWDANDTIHWVAYE